MTGRSRRRSRPPRAAAERFWRAVLNAAMYLAVQVLERRIRKALRSGRDQADSGGPA